MFDVGAIELVVIVVVALLVIGPERLPALAAGTARVIRTVRRFIRESMSAVEVEAKSERVPAMEPALLEARGLRHANVLPASVPAVRRATVEERGVVGAGGAGTPAVPAPSTEQSGTTSAPPDEEPARQGESAAAGGNVPSAHR